MNNSNTTTTTTLTSTRSTVTTIGGGNNTTQACAACKYQRRKCAPDCILAPYFPNDRQRQFLNAHKLFGVSNIIKIIKFLEPPLKDQAMRTIIYQSDMRANDPVGGCYKYIQDLQSQIQFYKAELDLVLQQLSILRSSQQQQPQQQQQFYVGGGDNINNVVDPLLLSFYNPTSSSIMSPVAATSNYHYNMVQMPQQEEQDQQEQYNVIIMHENNNESNCCSSSLQQQQQQQQHDINATNWAMQNSISLSSLSLHGQQSSNASDEYDHKPMLDLPSDDTTNHDLGFDSQQLLHRSDEAVLFKIEEAVIKEGECIQQAQDHDLKSAATLFTLTNCTSS